VDALRRCLKQFLNQTSSVVALFRTREDDGKLGFNGMIKWDKGSNVITWTDDKDQRKATFGPEGTLESRDRCRAALNVWVEKTPSRIEQWALIKDDFMLVWDTLEKAFGKPKVDDI